MIYESRNKLPFCSMSTSHSQKCNQGGLSHLTRSKNPVEKRKKVSLSELSEMRQESVEFLRNSRY